MHLETVSLEAAVGHILCHNLADAQGRKAFAKGRVVRAEDLPRLAALGVRGLRVAILAPDDVHEDEAARRLAEAVAGPGLTASAPYAGRVNLCAAYDGPLAVAVEALQAINMIAGLTVATRPTHSLAQAGQALATIKIIPFAVPGADLARAKAEAQASDGVLHVRPLRLRQVGVVLVSSIAARLRVEQGVYPAIAARITALGGVVLGPITAPPDEDGVARALASLRLRGAELLIVAGETSVVDLDDVTPRAIHLMGGQIEHYGAPVEPGNLLLLAYLAPRQSDTAPLAVIGAPGCVRSRDRNIVDLLLPRLMAAEPLSRRDIAALGHGGLLP